ncbi:hypothetical protein HBHAL_3900 [Halobacillus halophilus DSM 2266]|uniref:Uncharacterized protein n=1 Tax=Halobacillus halophilus (strain ATCC 35676 / DSM 2266 / JCM 20832 / KCTC 3685 / LMG 17431 / NBRC 102448 / NCIMB 2269) TaxID=866895 RepID=I0JQ22_HALH3|nr:hypothetical protein HBHAL_3900 [Halobacillus halophilus DSM 2266]
MNHLFKKQRQIAAFAFFLAYIERLRFTIISYRMSFGGN